MYLVWPLFTTSTKMAVSLHCRTGKQDSSSYQGHHLTKYLFYNPNNNLKTFKKFRPLSRLSIFKAEVGVYPNSRFKLTLKIHFR